MRGAGVGSDEEGLVAGEATRAARLERVPRERPLERTGYTEALDAVGG